MTDDLAAEGDRRHAAANPRHPEWFGEWAYKNWPAIGAALRERDDLRDLNAGTQALLDAMTDECEEQRVRAETAEAANARYYFAGWSDQKAGRAYGETAPAHAAAVEARHAD